MQHVRVLVVFNKLTKVNWTSVNDFTSYLNKCTIHSINLAYFEIFSVSLKINVSLDLRDKC
jgi:hypothetical protein